MTFFSGESIRDILSQLIIDQDGNGIGDNSQIDCNSYELKIGPEAFVTTGTDTKPRINNILKLKKDDSFTIFSGQFALLITSEFVNIPKHIFAFISMKSKFKFLGLVNVSGFHVDPGYKGRILFTVYNAGPDDVTLKCGERAFTIWFAKLDNENTTFFYDPKKCNYNRDSITSDDVNKISGELYTPQVLSQRIQKIERSVRWKWTAFIVGVTISFFVGIIVAVASNFLTYILSDKVGYTRELKEEIILDLNDVFKTNNEKIDKLKSEVEELKNKKQKEKDPTPKNSKGT